MADIGIDDTTAEISLEFSDSDIADTNIYLTMSFVKTENGGWLIEWYAGIITLIISLPSFKSIDKNRTGSRIAPRLCAVCF